MRRLLRCTLAVLALLLLGTAPKAYAQDAVVLGTVVDSTTSQPLPGVNVVVEGLQLGAATDTQGQFRIEGVPTGEQTLVASFVGYDTKRIPLDVDAGTNEIRIQLSPAAVGLENVIVTALGVQRQERAIGYAVQEVEAAEIDQAGETNFISSLAGQVSGAQVSTSSQMGGSSRIILRGASSISGNNEPLIVVDGIPLDNSGFNSISQETGSGGYDYGNAAALINSTNVKSVTVLKGPSAAALYGSRAANGVIEIVTKDGSGREGIGVNIQQTLTMNQMYNFPDYQNKYGGGAWAPFSMNGQGQLVADFATDQSWGPRLDGRQVRQWYSYDNVNGLEGQTTPWVAHPNNVENFFRTGILSKTNVAFSQGAENFNYRLSVMNMTQRGNSPESEMERQTINFNGSLDLTDRLSSSVSANYINSEAYGRPGSGYSNAVGPWLQFNHFGQRQIELDEDAPMRDITRPDGTQRGWNWVGDPRAGNLIYANNPFWIREKNYQNDDTQRIYGRVRLAYDLMDNLTVSANARTDYYTLRQQERVAIGSVELSSYSESVYEVQETNIGGKVDYNGNITDDISLQALGGVNYRYNDRSENLGATEGGLVSREVYTLENSTSRPSIADYFQEQALFGVYGDVTLGYQDMLYLGGTLRNDWSSTLPADNNSYLYPSVNGSFVFTALPTFEDSDILSFGKIRATWARVGRDTNPYELSFVYPLQPLPFGSTQLQTLPNSLPNTNLKPEIKTGWEVGTQLEFLSNKIALDVTYYSEETRNQILGVEGSRASGYSSRVVNAGTIANRGFEVALNATPVSTGSFQWDVGINWAKNTSEVVSLAEGVESLPVNSTASAPPFGPQIVAREGEPYGSFFGRGFQYDENGNKVISGGAYSLSAPRILGSYLPDWTAGFSTTVSYKGFSANILLDGQKGGKIWSLSNLFGFYSGIVQETVANNVRQLGVIPQGVTSSGDPWTGRVDPNAFFVSFFGNQEAFIYDASYIKLRSVSISYTMPSRWFENTPVRRLSVSAVGRNVATLLKYTPNFDPTAVVRGSGNLQGIEAGQMPPNRSIGLRFNLGF
ncbi:SusC/RagA family TonB-linked outer membrane protein [Salisaeta longa]|uniref:SusC/RagA family TonB-linked outer membrane protein n=1 Tax=Salisaeta longa TaxID=503170 RepID=UPI0003B5C0DF|nr:SusC/RagA family TonB-linked outer membrane protein [Salisaeta longa]